MTRTAATTASLTSSGAPAFTSLPDGAVALLLDFPFSENAASASDAPVARLYEGACTHITAMQADALGAAYAAVEAALAAGQYAVVLASYEMGAALHALPAHPSATPLFEAYLFSAYQTLTATQRSAWLAAQTPQIDAPAGVLTPQASLTEAAFTDAIAQIQTAIRAGETYQINFTFPLALQSYGHPAALYRRLAEHQPVAYGAFLRLRDADGAVRWVLSRSPELFMQRQGRRMTVRPMKGTAPASAIPDENARRADALASDTKNRAENLMIVDLLRNDLGRIAEAGSVQVDQLFAVERYRTVLQMTSTVRATARAGLSLLALWRALFPCGSITGAPKHHTMRLIHGLETQARGLYTGALGWMDPPSLPNEPLGDFCFSVPIRTLTLDAQGRGALGVGGGIVHDSIAPEEWAECLLKARFLTDLPPQMGLIETFTGTVEGYPRLAAHKARLQRSAQALGLPWQAVQEQALVQQLTQARTQMAAGKTYRCRLVLQPSGVIALTTAVLQPLPTATVQLVWAEALGLPATLAEDVLLQHKTTRREVYDHAWQAAEKLGAFDAIFVNTAGQVTEGGRSTLLVRHGAQWRTPALACGVLPGVMRAALLENPSAYGFTEGIEEAVLTADAIRNADEMRVCNSLRGVLPAILADIVGYNTP